MKRIALVLLVLACVSCGKTPKENEWVRFYGYTSSDVAGVYAFSGAADAFKDLTENEDTHLCPDAQINVTATSAQTIAFQFSAPEHGFQKSFSGRTSLNANAFLISMYKEMENLKQYGLSATVLKNAEEDVRLEGYVTEDHYKREYNTVEGHYDTIFDYSVKYFFDVKKN